MASSWRTEVELRFVWLIVMCVGCAGPAEVVPSDTDLSTETETETETEAPSGCEAGGPPDLQVGKGERVFEPSEATDGRTILIHGTQGGYHTFVSLRGVHLDLSGEWTFVLKGSLDGEELATARLGRTAKCNEEVDAGEIVGTWLIWRSHPSQLHGQQVVIDATVTDPLGQQVQAQTTQIVWDEREW